MTEALNPKQTRKKKVMNGSTMVIRVATGKMYADIMSKLRRKVNPTVRSWVQGLRESENF